MMRGYFRGRPYGYGYVINRIEYRTRLGRFGCGPTYLPAPKRANAASRIPDSQPPAQPHRPARPTHSARRTTSGGRRRRSLAAPLPDPGPLQLQPGAPAPRSARRLTIKSASGRQLPSSQQDSIISEVTGHFRKEEHERSTRRPWRTRPSSRRTSTSATSSPWRR